MISVSFAPKRQAAVIDHFAPTNIGSLLRRYPYRVRIDPFYRGAQMGPVAAWVSTRDWIIHKGAAFFNARMR
jgi:hypothetical protein